MAKNTHLRPRLIVVTIIGLFFTVVFSGLSRVQALGPPGCDAEHPYNCAMSRRVFDQQIASWCALAKSDKQAACKLSFYTFVYRSPAAVKSNAKFTIPDYCAPGFKLSPTQTQNVPDFCYVIPIHSGAYYKAWKSLVDSCDVGKTQDAQCARDAKQQFIHDYNKDWASAPNTKPDPNKVTGTSSTKAENTPFIKRMNIYLKWFSSGIGILAVFGLVIAGIQYTAAGDNPQAVSDAKKRITNIVIGILIYIFMFALLQWLMPGGLFTG